MVMHTHRRCPMLGSRISAAHLPHGRCRTPRYVLFFPLLTTPGSSGWPPSPSSAGSADGSAAVRFGEVIAFCKGCGWASEDARESRQSHEYADTYQSQ